LTFTEIHLSKERKKMPSRFRTFLVSLSLGLFGTVAIISAQTPQATQTTTANPPTTPLIEKQPTSAEIMRERISKAKAYIAVRNYNAAIYELENIRRETSDSSVNAVTNVLLMNTYLEQGDYKRAQDFLGEFFRSYKSNSASGNLYYSAIAGQVIKGARNQVERYRSLGLNVSDRNLPLEAVNDIERMREILEVVIAQSKELGGDKTKAATAMALLEEATNSRAIIARDDYDARRWRDALGDSREQLANSRSVIINAVDGTTVANPVQQDTTATINTNAPTMTNTVAQNIPTATPSTNPANTPAVFKPVASDNTPKTDTSIQSNNRPVNEQPKQTQPVTEPQRTRVIDNRPTVQVPMQTVAANTTAEMGSSSGPLDVGSLIGYATKQQAPVYPAAAKSMRATGVVKVEVTVNEKGEVTEVNKSSGPTLLQAAAKDAIRKWTFKPFVKDGQPVKATGFVNFNFSL
jgi:TonB family protein